MTDYHVFSRHTDIIIGQREAWYEQLKGERLEWEDLAAAESTNELLRMLDPVPLYQYIVNYLLYLWEDEFSEEAMCEQVISDLIDRVASAFEKNGMPEEKCAKAYIRDMLTTEWSREWDSFEKAASRRIFELGLGLGLPAEDVEQLLKKAVKRAGFNYYDPEELLVYCALRFCHRNHFVCFQALKRDFKSIHPAGSAKEKFYFGSTTEVRDRMMEILEQRVSGLRLYSTPECTPGTLTPEFEDFFARYKASVPDFRTAAVVFTELLRQFTEVHKEEILTFKKADRSTEEYAETVLKVEYDAQQEIVLPAGAIFYAVRGRKKQKVSFVLEKKTILPVQENVNVVISVQGTEKYEVCLAKKTTPGYAGKDTKLIPDEAALRAGVLFANTATTLRYTGKPGEMRYAEGEICAVCRPGAEIPEGTAFYIDNYTYKILKNCTANASEEIKVRSTDPSRECEKLAETGEVRFMENCPAGIIRISNAKPVQIKKITETITKELFRDFLYGSGSQKLDASERLIDSNLIGSWFTETEISSSRFSDIQKQTGKSKSIKREMMENSAVRRCDIVTIAFLNFCMDADSQPIEEYMIEEDPEAVYKDFVAYVNGYLKQCGMSPFYLKNPYECLLAYLIQTDTPVDSLRNMWKIVKARKEGTDE